MTGPRPQRSLLDRYGRGPDAVGPLTAAVELAVGILSFLAVAVTALLFVHRPSPDGLDSWVERQLNADYSSPWAHHVTALGSKPVLVIGVMVLFGVGLRRDWLRALACAGAPLAAVVIVEKVAKPLGEHLGLDRNGTFPSGTLACVVALSVGAVLVAPKFAKLGVAVLGAVAAVAVATAVVVLRWHYPTDALAGVGVGVGTVLAADGGLHLAWRILRHPLPSVPADVRPADGHVLSAGKSPDPWGDSGAELAEVTDAGSAR